jgi:hypothetical protein
MRRPRPDITSHSSAAEVLPHQPAARPQARSTYAKWHCIMVHRDFLKAWDFPDPGVPLSEGYALAAQGALNARRTVRRWPGKAGGGRAGWLVTR